MAPATIRVFAEPEPTPLMLIAVAMPTDESGETIKIAKAIPSVIPINSGESEVLLSTKSPIQVWTASV